MAVTVDRRLYLAADNETLVEDGDPNAAFLWASEGDEVSDDEAKRVGYKPSRKSSRAAEDKSQAAPAEDKSASRSRKR